MAALLMRFSYVFTGRPLPRILGLEDQLIKMREIVLRNNEREREEMLI